MIPALQKTQNYRRFYSGTLVLLLVLCTVVLPILFGWPESFFGKTLHRARSISHPEAVVILAGGGDARVKAGARVFLEQRPPWVVLTNDGVRGGWSRPHQRNLFQIERHGALLQQLGVPEAAIVSLPFSRSGTRFDAEHVRQWAMAQGVKQLLLVTSDYHSRRTLWTFETIFAGTGIGIGLVPVRDNLVEGNGLFAYWSRGILLIQEGVKLVGYRFLVH